MAVCDSTTIQTEPASSCTKPFLSQSETCLSYTTSNTNDCVDHVSHINPCMQTMTTNEPTNEIPQVIQWNDIPISCVGKPDLSRIRTYSSCSNLSSAFSDIQLHGPSSLAYDEYEDLNDPQATPPIYIESLVLSRTHTIDVSDIGLPPAIHENGPQDSYESYDSPSDSEPDDTPTPTSRYAATALEIQKTHKIYVRNSTNSDSGARPHSQHSESTFDYNDEILPQNTPTLVKHLSSFDICPPLPCECDANDIQISTTQPQITQIISNTTITGKDEIKNVKNTQSYRDICNTLLMYKWQKPIVNEQNYGAFYPNFQREIMNNPFFKLAPGDFNDVLKKCQFIRSRWIGEKIRSTRPGQLGKHKWKIGEKITELDLFAIKLYTDFEVCQRELKKCYRPPDNGNKCDLYQYEQRLCYFSNWRRLLNVAILKYGTFLKNRVFYHSINKIMQLDIHPTNRYHGPFSATSDPEIARGFATKHGLILKMTSKFPRLGTDYFFDAAPICEYPDEKEYLIGFLYARILNVSLGCTKLSISDFTNETIEKLMCFILSSLIKNNLYSYGPYLEILFHALLHSDKCYAYSPLLGDNYKNELVQIANVIPQIIRDEFIKIRKNIKVLKLDVVSEGMRALFYDDEMLSMRKIYEYTPNMQELHLYENEYKVNNEFICDFLYFIKLYEYKLNLDTIKFFKYSFEGSSQQFQFKQSISKSNEMKLQILGWYIYEYHKQNCYKFILTKKKKN